MRNLPIKKCYNNNQLFMTIISFPESHYYKPSTLRKGAFRNIKYMW